MPMFTARQLITEAPPSVTLRLPMRPGQSTNVSEDEAVALRALPELFAELTWDNEQSTWTGQSPMNRMVSGAAVTKAEVADAAPLGAEVSGEDAAAEAEE